MYDKSARLQEQVGLFVQAFESEHDTRYVNEIVIAGLSPLGRKAVSYLTSALSRALENLESNPNLILSDPGVKSHYASERTVVGVTRVLGIIGDPESIQSIEKALPRPEAVMALSKIGGKNALNTLIRCLKKWYISEKYQSDSWARADDLARKAFGNFGEEAVTELKELMNKGDDESRAKAARLLGILESSSSIPAILERLEDQDLSVKLEAAIALRTLKAKQALSKITSELIKISEILQSEKEYPKRSELLHPTGHELAKAVLELGSINDWIAVAFHHPEIEVRGIVEINSAIINSGDDAVPALMKQLEASDRIAQKKAAEMIAKIKRGEKDDPRSHYF